MGAQQWPCVGLVWEDTLGCWLACRFGLRSVFVQSARRNPHSQRNQQSTTRKDESVAAMGAAVHAVSIDWMSGRDDWHRCRSRVCCGSHFMVVIAAGFGFAWVSAYVGCVCCLYCCFCSG